jgi:Tol biopolymer transport system component
LHVSVDLPPEMGLSPETEILGINDDGSILAIGVDLGGRSQLAVRRLDKDELKVVQGSAGLNGSAVFSPDGSWLVFNADNKIYKTPVAGGPATQIGNSRWAQMAWAGNNTLVYTKNYDSGLFRISSEGRDSAAITTPDRKKGELGHWWPQALPDGDHVLFTNYTTPADQSKIEVISLKSGKRKVVFEGGYYGRFVSGHLVFVRDNGLMSVPFDLDGLKATGSALPVPLDVEIDPPNGWAALAIAPNGTIAYRTDASRSIQLTWSDEGGNEEIAIDSVGRFTDAAPSPDGRRIGVVRDGDVWVFDRQRKLFSRLTNTAQRETNLTWTPDSRQLIYSRDVPQYDIFMRSADGSRPEERLITSPNDKDPSAVSPDGRSVLFEESTEDADIFEMSLNPADRAAKRKILGGQGEQSDARFSPDGQWIAYTSSESGRPEVYVAPYPVDRGPVRQQLSDAGGEAPMWGADGRTVYYAASGRITRVRVNPRTGEIGRPELLTKIPPATGWTTAPDGRFLVARPSRSMERHSIKVVLNWASSLGKN